MRVKPEDLKMANRVAGIKETTSTTARRNYWNAVHRLVTQAGHLVLRTNDGSMWLDWNIPIEGAPMEMDVLVSERQFDHAARYLEGGSLDITRANRVVTLGKGQLHYRMKEETPQTYPEPVLGENPATWRTTSSSFAKALRFVTPFIDETNPAKHKSVATLYTTGFLTGGNPQRISTVKGLHCEAEMSFKLRTAKMVAEFLTCIGENVEITVTDRCYKFRDPDGNHTLIVLAEEGRFPFVDRDLRPLIREIDNVDRKTLLQRAKAFAGAMPVGADRLNLSFRGEGDTASMHVFTPGEDRNEITEDELPTFREFPEKEGETEEERQARTGPLDIGVNREFLSDALDAMEGTSVKFKFCGRMILVEDEVPQTDDGTDAGPEKSILLTAKQSRAGEEDDGEPTPERVTPVLEETPDPEEDEEEEEEEEEVAAVAE